MFLLIAVNVFGDEREIEPVALENMRCILNLNIKSAKFMVSKLHFIKLLYKGEFYDISFV